ncbi:MAG: tetratricopeptide repeat protein [Isosphaeraceae bacterium]
MSKPFPEGNVMMQCPLTTDWNSKYISTFLPLFVVAGLYLAGPPRADGGPAAAPTSAELMVGAEVVLTEPETMLLDGERKLPSRGERLFHVERLLREYADIATEDRTVRGWVAINQILPLDRAINYFNKKIVGDPKDAEAYHARGQIWIEKEQWDKALADIDSALRLAPERDADMAVLLRDRGLAWDAKRLFDRAVADLTEAIRLDPGNPGLVLARGRVRARRGRHKEGMADIDWYIRMRPHDPAGYTARGEALQENMESEAALAEFGRALDIDSTYVPALRRRAETWRRRREFARMIDDYAEATRRAPGDVESHRALAWILATCIRPEQRDGPRAVREATAACELTHWNDLDCLAALAAAYAEAGDFTNAARWQARAVKLVPRKDPSWRIHKAREDMYQAGKPYRD